MEIRAAGIAGVLTLECTFILGNVVILLNFGSLQVTGILITVLTKVGVLT